MVFLPIARSTLLRFGVPLAIRALANPLKSASRDVAWLVPEDPSELSRNGTNPKTLIDLIPLTRHLGFALQTAP